MKGSGLHKRVLQTGEFFSGKGGVPVLTLQVQVSLETSLPEFVMGGKGG